MRPRFENLEAERQERLFDSAAEEFGARGFAQASLNRILERSGMSKSSLYYYFEDKADLFTSLVERSIVLLFREIGGFDSSSLTADTYWPELESLYTRAVAVLNRNVWYVKLGRVFYRLRGEGGQGGPTGRTFEAARRWVDLIISRGQELGVVRTDLPRSMLVDATMGLGEALDRWMVIHWDELGEAARLEMAGKQMQLLRMILSA